jgi:hypothetical protein
MCPSGHFRDAFSVFLESAKADIGLFIGAVSTAGQQRIDFLYTL